MARPEGYRKANRLMKLADKFNIPIITFIDTAGAYPGVGAEERGQAEAIAACIQTSLEIRVPVISVIIGSATTNVIITIFILFSEEQLFPSHLHYNLITHKPAGVFPTLVDHAHGITFNGLISDLVPSLF